MASKYTRLASEYSKVRAQLTILKRAIIEEQSSKNHFAEALKEKETRGRKIEAEMDALTFRNIQLARRVEILQQESEQKQQKTVKKATRNEIVAASEDVNSVMGEELSLKIAENARLHAALDEVDKKYEAKISNLTSHISDLESQLKRLAQKDRAEDTKQKDLIQGLKVNNVRYQNCPKKSTTNLLIFLFLDTFGITKNSKKLKIELIVSIFEKNMFEIKISKIISPLG